MPHHLYPLLPALLATYHPLLTTHYPLLTHYLLLTTYQVMPHNLYLHSSLVLSRRVPIERHQEVHAIALSS